tara:strand:- start:1493 stop:1840 length:348 start_codon:yes stop_codon:yes gene_type:complete
MAFKISTLLSITMLIMGVAFGQNPCNSDICVVQFNASWNGANSINYLEDLTDCKVMNVSIDSGTWQKEYGIVVVPTVIVFNGEEVERFQADLSFKIAATREDVQNIIDDIIYSDF